MKILKKLTAVVAMVVICLATMTPMTSAKAESCSHTDIRKTQSRRYIGTSEHTFDLVMDLNGDNRPEIVTTTCEYLEYDVYDIYLCNACYFVVAEWYFYEEYHDSTFCDKYGGYYRYE